MITKPEKPVNLTTAPGADFYEAGGNQMKEGYIRFHPPYPVKGEAVAPTRRVQNLKYLALVC